MTSSAKEPMEVPEDEEEFDELMDEDEEIDIVCDGSGQDAETNKFDQIVGCLEDILMDTDFEDARESFCRSNCSHFEDTDENKLVYTEIFAQYTEMVESCIEERLLAAVPGFDMGAFMAMMEARKEELVSDVFDLMLSLGDFATFKELMLAYKREGTEEGGGGFVIECHPMHLHGEDQEEGDLRPDLDFSLAISPAGPGHGRRFE